MGFELIERPAQSLVGMMWEGTYAEAAAHGVHQVIRAMLTVRHDLTKMPAVGLVGISWNDRPGGFRYLVAVEIDDACGNAARASVTAGLTTLRLPAMRLATCWHGTDDGDITRSYMSMFEWIAARGLRRDVSLLHHREEYPADLDLAAPPVLRLMTPVARA